MRRVAVLTCLLGFSAIGLGACVYGPGPAYAQYPAPQYAPSYGPSSAPYDSANPTVIHRGEGAHGG
jgi:hypothetical protein